MSARGRFRAAYRVAALFGGLANVRGDFQRRVYREWVKAGRPANVERFIRQRANRRAV